MALQGFEVLSAEWRGDHWHCEVASSGNITMVVTLGSGKVPALMVAVTPRYRGGDCHCADGALCADGCAYRGSMRVDEIDMRGVSSLTLDTTDARTDRIWGYTRHGEFVLH